MDELNTKKCKACGKTLPIDQFYKAKSMKDGRISFCKSCYLEKRRKKSKEWLHKNKDRIKEVQKLWRQNNKEKLKEYHKKYQDEHAAEIKAAKQEAYYEDIGKSREHLRAQYRKHTQQRLYNSAKRRAKNKGYDFNIELEDVVVPEFCPVLGIKLCNGDGVAIDSSYSLDRIDTSIGYVKGNVVVVSYKVNTMKSNGTIEDMEKIVRFYKKLTGGD